MNQRRQSLAVDIAGVQVGGGAPVVVQSMTSTDTEDVMATLVQIKQLADAGSELVRVTVNTVAAAEAVVEIKQRLLDMGINTPIVGDFHFNGGKILEQVPDCAKALDKYRINPGNIAKSKASAEDDNGQFAQIVRLAVKYNKAVRIGVNWGSLDQKLLAQMLDDNAQLAQPLSLEEVQKRALIESALRSAELAKHFGLAADKIIISCKLSNVQALIDVYQRLAQQCDYPLHLGLTEAGTGNQGVVSSSAAMAILLQQGIGDTIRISLTPTPGEARETEVRVGQQILQSLGLRSFTPQVISCPGCGRTSSDYFQHLATDIQAYLQNQMPIWQQQYPGVESMTVAVMGCVVNGPGESKNADIGISLPGTGETPIAPVYEDGKKTVTLKGDDIAAQFQSVLVRYVRQRYAASTV